ncbi:sugar phosphate isomerase/epimerase family protein [Salinigranum halophilum]|jgi:sugar phosphate isomerase/epimerase|uniref:sugar phosphate isomerase/epimerase family protein n=1 Tax=Salinigranum halophilum TaxID=2565931 RepID=UPI0010A77498|nr:sugar phosphate isomerase/epimerase family protein [Salinigranum halophilum]
MRFGAALDLRYDQSFEAFVAFLRDRDLSHVELRQGYLDTHPDAPSAARVRRVAAEADVTVTLHAPYRDCNLGNLNERLREATVEAVCNSLDFAAEAGAAAVVVHGGSVRPRYPERVQRQSRERAVRSLRTCGRYAEDVGVPLCVENQRDTSSKRRNTATPERLAALLDDVGVDSVRVTLDVGHAKVAGVDYRAFVDRFGDRITVAHLHDNDGADDDHDPLPTFRSVGAAVGAPYNVLEMKSLADIERCVAGPTDD